MPSIPQVDRFTTIPTLDSASRPTTRSPASRPRFSSTTRPRFRKPNRRCVLPQADRLYATLSNPGQADRLPHSRFRKPTDDTFSRKPLTKRHAPILKHNTRSRFHKLNRRHVLDRRYATLSNPPAVRLPNDFDVTSRPTTRYPASRPLPTSLWTKFASTNRLEFAAVLRTRTRARPKFKIQVLDITTR
ncbi:hypothetical protein BDZ89DRAFT_1062250 [Hymenopellis radicata]|nr:hypothetical protein BDZ89DRAFT_1062250 [Hymenopellis radicata]